MVTADDRVLVTTTQPCNDHTLQRVQQGWMYSLCMGWIKGHMLSAGAGVQGVLVLIAIL